MELNLTGKSPVDLDFRMFVRKADALRAAHLAGAVHPMAVPAQNRFCRFWLAIDSRHHTLLNTPVPMIRWLGKAGWGTHAHPGHLAGGKRVRP